jgi:hypothetical protein
MNNISKFLISYLTIISIGASHASDELERAFTPSSGQMVVLEEAAPKNSYEWLEMKGVNIRGLHFKSLKKKFSAYDEPALQSLLEQIDATGVLAKCKTGSDLAKLLREMQKARTLVDRDFLKWVHESGAIGGCHTLDNVIALFKKLDQIHTSSDHDDLDQMARLGLFLYCANFEHIMEFLNFRQDLRKKSLTHLWGWFHNTQVLHVCKDLYQTQGLLLFITNFSVEHGGVLTRLGASDVFRLCENQDHVQKLLMEMVDFKDKVEMAHSNRGQDEKVFFRLGAASNQEFRNMDQVFEYLRAVKGMKAKPRRALRKWLHELEQMKDGNRANLLKTLRAIKGMDEALRAEFLDFFENQHWGENQELKQCEYSDQLRCFVSRDEALRRMILDYVQVGAPDEQLDVHVGALVETLRSFSADERSYVLSLPFSYDHNKERKYIYPMAQRYQLLRFFLTLEPNLRSQLLAWQARISPKGKLPGCIHTLSQLLKAYEMLAPVATPGNEEAAAKVVGPVVTPSQDAKGKEEAVEVVQSSLGQWFLSSNWFEKSNSFSDLEKISELYAKAGKSYECLDRECEKLIASRWIDQQFLLLLWKMRVERLPQAARVRVLGTLKAFKELDETLRKEILSILREQNLKGQENLIGSSQVCGSLEVFHAFFGTCEASQKVIIDDVDAGVECETNAQLAATIDLFQAFSAQERSILLSLPLSPGQGKQPRSVATQRLDVLKFSYDFEPELRAKIIAWLGKTLPNRGYCSAVTGDVLAELLEHCGSGSEKAPSAKGKEEVDEFTSELGLYLKKTNWFGRSQNFKNLEDLINLYTKSGQMSISKFGEACKSLGKSGLIDGDFLTLVMSKLKSTDLIYQYLSPLIIPELPLLTKGVGKDGPVEESLQIVYLSLLAAGYENDKISEYFEGLLKERSTRTRFLELVVKTLGEDHDLSQYYMILGIKYVDIANDYGTVATHVHMLKRRAETVVHKPQSEVPGCVINVDHVTEPCPPVAPHMPVTVWHSMFDGMLKLPADSYQAELQADTKTGFSAWTVSSFAGLKSETSLTSLLDPAGSKEARKDINGYSRKLRLVLAGVQADLKDNPDNYSALVQLCVNIMSCQTSKLNGITHSEVYRNNSKLLKDCDLESLVFRQELEGLIKDELRRFREILMSKYILLTYGDSPHTMYFARGVLGKSIGIMFKDEVPKIDLNNGGVLQSLRDATQQNLLDAFYAGYSKETISLADKKMKTVFHPGYTVQTIISRITEYFKTSIDGANNLVIKVICNMFGAKAMTEDGFGFDDQWVVIDDNKKPSLTELAVKELLLTFGILKPTEEEVLQ